MKEYTEKEHAERLIRMLETVGPVGRCPASADILFGWKDGPKLGEWPNTEEACIVCNTFLGHTGEILCPCYYFESGEEAVKQSWIALKEKGYI